MTNNEPLTAVTTDQKKHIANGIWKKIHLEQPNLSTQVNPKAYLIGGQPGAGKSVTTQSLLRQYDKNIVLIDLDTYRDTHPNHQALQAKYGKDTANYTHSFAGEIKDEILKKAVDAKYNIVVDGTLKNVDNAKKLINHLDDKGYKVDVLIKTCPKDVSFKSIEQRYEALLKKGETPRYVPKEVHDAVVKVLPKNGHELYNNPKVSKLEVHNRESKVYDSKQDKLSPFMKILSELTIKTKETKKPLSLTSSKIPSRKATQSFKKEKEKGFSR